tara:strand:+ start:17034 stop:17399 length:366 start_codon:yes stop_codon:yes gene_type:complete
MQTQKISKRHGFLSLIIVHVVLLCAGFNLSLREVEGMMLNRGVDVSYETILRRNVKFGPRIAHVLRLRQPHLADFRAAYNFSRRLKTLNGLTLYAYICKIWTSEPDRFNINPIHQLPRLNT